MTPLPAALEPGEVVTVWHLVKSEHLASWHSGQGAYLLGGRWNSVGVRAVYGALDPATAILEVAVHKGFQALDRVPHHLVRFEIQDAEQIAVIRPVELPNPAWLAGGTPSAGQQQFGDQTLARRPFMVIPSVVSRRSWNLVVNAGAASGLMSAVVAERFALDTRLNPPAARSR